MDEVTYLFKIYANGNTYVPINIWLPATEYYKYFKGYLDYTMIEPYGYNATTVQTATN